MPKHVTDISFVTDKFHIVTYANELRSAHVIMIAIICNSLNAGWRGLNCSEDIDECDDAGICLNGATCVNSQGSYSCQCVPGYVGQHCGVDVNECESEPCQNAGVCGDEVDGFTCDCSETGSFDSVIVGYFFLYLVLPAVRLLCSSDGLLS